MEDLSKLMETMGTLAQRMDYHMYRIHQLEKEVDDIEAEISMREARLVQKDVSKEAGSQQ